MTNEDGIITSASAQDFHKLKVAFVGGAFDSAVGRAHRVAIEMDQRFELVAGCFSRNQTKSVDSALKYRINPSRAYSDLNSLLKYESEDLDVIMILSPQDQHFSQLKKCLDKDVPIVCEKALVASVAEGLEIQELLTAKNRLVAVTYNYTGYPMVRELKSMIESGVFGKIQQVYIEMPQEGFARMSECGEPVTPQEWRLRDGDIPTISLDLGVHLHMLVKFLTNAHPEEVVATSSTRGNFHEVTDNVQCLAKYSENIDCNIWYSKTAFGYRNGLRLRIFGTKGGAEWVQDNPEYLQFADNEGGKYCLDRASKNSKIANQIRYERFKAGHPAGFLEAFANYYSDIADVIQRFKDTRNIDFGEYVFGVEESLEGLKMLEAISRSTSSGQWERVN